MGASGILLGGYDIGEGLLDFKFLLIYIPSAYTPITPPIATRYGAMSLIMSFNESFICVLFALR